MLSVPVLGAYVEQVIFGTLDDKANREKRAELRALFDSLGKAQRNHTMPLSPRSSKQPVSKPRPTPT